MAAYSSLLCYAMHTCILHAYCNSSGPLMDWANWHATWLLWSSVQWLLAGFKYSNTATLDHGNPTSVQRASCTSQNGPLPD